MRPGKVQLNPRQDEEVKACLDALYVTDTYLDRESLLNSKGTRTTGTCEWIRDNETYRSWLESENPDTDFLWIYGGPGKGKTMLSIFLTQELEDRAQQINANLIYFFSSNQHESRNTAVAILKGLLYQVVYKHPHLIKHLLRPQPSEHKMPDRQPPDVPLPQKGLPERRPTLGEIPERQSPEYRLKNLSSVENLWIIFKNVVQDPGLGSTFCLIDGLDECDEESKNFLAEKFPQLGQTRQTKFKLIIVSRDIAVLHKLPTVKLDHDNMERVEGDIERFISSKVEELSGLDGFDDEFREEVRDTLLKRAEGTFLWVGFVMNEISRKKTRTEVYEVLEDLPKGLDSIYDQMLLDIETKRQSSVSRILRWVTISERALTLQELAAVIGTPFPSTTRLSADQSIRDSVALCGLFLEIRGEEVWHVHRSARDYLLRKEPSSNPILEMFRIKPEEAHIELAQACLDCIQHSSLQYSTLSLGDLNSNEEPSILEYAIRYGAEHTRKSGLVASDIFDTSSSLFQAKSSVRKNWWLTFLGKAESDVSRNQVSFKVDSLLHFAAYFGISPWVDRLLSEKSHALMSRRPLIEKDPQGRTPLHVATIRGHEQAVELMLKRGAEIEARTKDKETALILAARKGHQKTLQLLLTHRADINAVNYYKRTALMLAAVNGQKESVQALINGSPNLEMKDSLGETALVKTISYGSGDTVSIVRLLLSCGANLSATDADGCSTLMRAALRGHKELVSLLLERNVSLETTSQIGATALTEAVSGGSLECVQLLLENGADIDAKDRFGLTAVMHSVMEGSEDILGVLLEREPGLEVRDKVGSSVLMLAAYEGQKEIVETLLDRGAAIEAKNIAGETALVGAAYNGKKEMVDCLLERGAIIENKSNEGNTPLITAAMMGNKNTVQLLLDRGADITATNDQGGTALTQAVLQGHEDVVQLLLQNGADGSNLQRERRFRLLKKSKPGNFLNSGEWDYFESLLFRYRFWKTVGLGAQQAMNSF